MLEKLLEISSLKYTIKGLKAKIKLLQKENKDYRGYFNSLEAKIKLLEKNKDA